MVGDLTRFGAIHLEPPRHAVFAAKIEIAAHGQHLKQMAQPVHGLSTANETNEHTIEYIRYHQACAAFIPLARSPEARRSSQQRQGLEHGSPVDNGGVRSCG